MRRLILYFAVTFLVTWTCWLTAPHIAFIVYLGVFAPGIVALAFTAWERGTDGVLALLRRLVQWNVAARWYAFALLYIFTIKLTAALIHRLLFGQWPRFGEESMVIMFAATILFTIVQAGEELGWRGYALPTLAGKIGYAWSSIIIGIIWAAWHLPLFISIPIGDTYHQSFPLYVVQVTAMSVAITWLYTRTNGSLLLPMLLHAAANNTKDIVPSAVPGATNPLAWSTSAVANITVVLLWICAGYFLRRMGRANIRVMSSPRSSVAIVVMALATMMIFAQTASASDRWQSALDQSSDLLAKGQFAGAGDRLSRLTRDMADEITTPSERDRLFALALAQLAVAEAGEGKLADAVWHWQIAQNVHHDARTFDLTPYGKNTEVLASNSLPPTPEKCERSLNAPAPAVLQRSEPKYPKRAQKSSVTGVVIVEMELDPEGRPIRPQVLRSPSAALTYSTLVTLREWRFAAPEVESDRAVRFCRAFSFGQHQ